MMTPHDQMSILVDWEAQRSKISGARNPGVPARGTFNSGFARQPWQMYELSAHSHMRCDSDVAAAEAVAAEDAREVAPELATFEA